MQPLIPTDVYDENKNLIRIEFYDLEAKFIFQAEWTGGDQQSHEQQQLFRKESYLNAELRGYEIIE